MKARTLATGLGMVEGPVVLQSGDVLVTSLDQGAVYVIDASGPRRLAECGGGPNGAAEGREGRVYIAQSGGRWGAVERAGKTAVTGGVQVVDADGAVSWLSTAPASASDLCFGPDGLLYVTDPTRFRWDEGRLWRVDPADGAADLLAELDWFPNGIAFGPDDDFVYVASTSARQIVRFPLAAGGLGRPEVCVQMVTGRPDGITFDAVGNLLVAAVAVGDRPGQRAPGTGQIQVWDPEGRLLDVFAPGPGWLYTNIAFSEARTLIVTDAAAGTVLAYDRWPAAGLPTHPFRRVAAGAESPRNGRSFSGGG